MLKNVVGGTIWCYGTPASSHYCVACQYKEIADERSLFTFPASKIEKIILMGKQAVAPNLAPTHDFTS